MIVLNVLRLFGPLYPLGVCSLVVFFGIGCLICKSASSFGYDNGPSCISFHMFFLLIAKGMIEYLKSMFVSFLPIDGVDGAHLALVERLDGDAILGLLLLTVVNRHEGRNAVLTPKRRRS